MLALHECIKSVYVLVTHAPPPPPPILDAVLNLTVPSGALTRTSLRVSSLTGK